MSDSTELRTFITAALRAVSSAVSDARCDSEISSCMIVAPPVTPGKMAIDANLSLYQVIKFDLCVRVTTESSAGGQLSVVSAIVGKVSSVGTNDSTSRMSFGIPVLFIPHPLPPEAIAMIEKHMPNN